MTGWLVFRTLRRAPRRLVLGAVGIAFPVAMLAATLLYVDDAVQSMTRRALHPVQIEQKALATTLDQDLTALGHRIARVPGVARVDAFGAADVIVSTPGARATARLIAVDPQYLQAHHFAPVVHGRLSGGALLNQNLAGAAGFRGASEVSIEVPGQGPPLHVTLPVNGTIDVRTATTWFEIPAGGVQGDVARVPRSVVIDYSTFVHRVLPALRSRVGLATPVLNPDLSDLPPVTLEAHIAVDHGSYPSDPAAAALWSAQLRRQIERLAPGKIIVADNAFEVLTEASVDADDARILFLLLGIPGVLVAAALGLVLDAVLAEAYRREDALLRLRGATASETFRLTLMLAAATGAVGIGLGLLAAWLAVATVTGRTPGQGLSTGHLVATALVAALAGVLTTSIRVVRSARAGRQTNLAAERGSAEAGPSLLARRPWAEIACGIVGLAILAINVANGGLHQTQVQGPSVALSFYVLIGPVLLWLALTLLLVRAAFAVAARRAMPDHVRPLRSWGRAAMRWLARRPARAAASLALGTLAVAFAAQVVTFVATYAAAKRADARASFGSDLRLTARPADVSPELPRLGPDVAAVTPIRQIGTRVGTDRKTILIVDTASYNAATSLNPRLASGGGLAALAHRPDGILISAEIARDEQIGPGDRLPLTLFPDDKDKTRLITPVVVGVYTSFPPTSPVSELVLGTRAIPSYLLPAPEFYLARAIAGHSPEAVAAQVRGGPAGRAFNVTSQPDPNRADQRSLTTLNLGGLGRIEALGAGLIAAAGIALLGAFSVLERRREFAVLRTVGASPRQLVDGPLREGTLVVVGSLVAGLPIGIGLAMLSVRVLQLLFVLPPPVVAVPAGALTLLAAAVLVASGVALGLTLRAALRVRPAVVLRDP